MAKRKSVKRKARPKVRHRAPKWAPLPQSNATNALELLRDVCVAILQEPLRYDQGMYVQLATEKTKDVPACGTMACVAGWTTALRTPDRHELGRLDHEFEATALLGISCSQAYGLFNGDAIIQLAVDMSIDIPNEGTLEYAALGVLRIAKFMALNAEQLRAHKLGKR